MNDDEPTEYSDMGALGGGGENCVGESENPSGGALSSSGTARPLFCPCRKRTPTPTPMPTPT